MDEEEDSRRCAMGLIGAEDLTRRFMKAEVEQAKAALAKLTKEHVAAEQQESEAKAALARLMEGESP
jgi:hypothetical protein